MYQAKELIKFTSKNLREIAKKKYVPSNNLTKSNKIIQLYQQDYSEEEIAKLLYNKTGKDQNFRKLKSRMIEKSAKSILLQMDNIKMRNKYDINIFLVQKLLLVSNLLLIKDNKNIAELLLKKAFRVALAVQFTPYIIQISRILRYFSAFNCNNVSFHYYDLTLKNYFLIYEKELELESDYFVLLPQIIKIAEYDDKTKRNIASLFLKAQSIIKKNKSHSLQLLYYRIAIRYYHSTHQFPNLKSTCRQAIKYLNTNQNLFQNALAGEFSLYEMDACLRLKAYSQGSECASRCEKYFIPYTSAWSVFFEYYFLLTMLTSNYNKADEIFAKINNSNYKLNKMLSRQKDKWKINEAFLFFAINGYSALKQFNLYKYLNEIVLLNKDKKGYNFLVIISKFLLLLNIQNHEGLILMEDSFEVYFRRYINIKEHPRHHIFGKFILFIFKQNFDINDSDASVYMQKLESYNILEETEIIPYEKLIKLVVIKCKDFNK